MLLGPPCRTVSSLRYQGDGGPGVLRDDENPYGRPDLSPSDMGLVEGDVTLWFRGLSPFILAEDVRDQQGSPTQLVLEQPEDPARYRKPQDVEQHRYFAVFRTREWQQFQRRFDIEMLHFDQHPMGHKKRKPTTLVTNMTELFEINGIRREPEDEQKATEAFRAMSMQQRIQGIKNVVMLGSRFESCNLNSPEQAHDGRVGATPDIRTNLCRRWTYTEGVALTPKTINLCRRWTYTEGAIVFLKVNSKAWISG